jgi:hypothetical protein
MAGAEEREEEVHAMGEVDCLWKGDVCMVSLGVVPHLKVLLRVNTGMGSISKEEQ